MDFDYKSMPVVTVYNSYKRKLIDTTPDFQRDLIWKKSFKEELIISMLKRYPIGNIVFNINEGITEIVDGKQRLTSIFEFLDKDKPLYLSKNSSIKEFREFIHYYMEKNENILSDEEKNQCQKLKSVKKVFYKDLPSILKDDFNSYNLNVTYLKNTESEQEVAEYFTRLQNQESLRAGEIVNSVLYYNKELFNLFDLLEDEDYFCEILNFKRTRNQFSRIFINIVGLLDGKLSLNCQSDEIINYAKSYKKHDNPKINLLINKINEFTLLATCNYEKNATIRFVILFMLLLALKSDKMTVTELFQLAKCIEEAYPNLSEKDIGFKLFERSRSLKKVIEGIDELYEVNIC